jgi:hypothetical protein
VYENEYFVSIFTPFYWVHGCTDIMKTTEPIVALLKIQLTFIQYRTMSKDCPYQDNQNLHSLPCNFQRHPGADKQHLYFCSVCEKICDTQKIPEEKKEKSPDLVSQLLLIAGLVLVGLLTQPIFEKNRLNQPAQKSVQSEAL